MQHMPRLCEPCNLQARSEMNAAMRGLFLFLGFLGISLLASEAARAELPVEVIEVNGESHAGTLTNLSADEIKLSIDNRSRTFEARDVLQIRFDHKRLKPDLWGAAIFLANGDRLLASPETIDDTAGLARWQAFPGWKSVPVPLETISGFILEIPEIGSLRREALRTVMDREQKVDLVDLKNGDQAGGEFLALNDRELRLETPVGETKIERDSIRLVTMNRELISFPEIKGPAMLLSLTDGSLLTVTDLKIEADDRLSAQAAFGSALDLPLSAVMTMRNLAGGAVYLSELKPADYQHRPYLAQSWSLKQDRNVLGGPLRLDGVEYPKGLGMHSQSRVQYDLNGKFQTFRAILGVDDAAENAGSVVFAVEVDGKQVFQSDPQTGKHSAIALPPVSLKEAQQLTLRVEFGEFGDVRDYANWCDAVLIP